MKDENTRSNDHDPSYDFDRIIDRADTNAIATDAYRKYLLDDEESPGVGTDVISMWVADMGFASAPAAIEAMRERLEHPIFGYSVLASQELFNAFAAWCQRYYGWAPEAGHFVTSPGVVPALHDLVEFVLAPGQKALTLTPAYSFFDSAAAYHGRETVTCALQRDDENVYSVDFEDFEAKVADPLVRMFFLCHPHNPTGRVWSNEELRRMADLCFANNVLVVSDEIHCDLLRHGQSHTPLASLFPHSDQIVTTMSSSKTFNLAGLGLAHIVIPNEALREVWLDRQFPVLNPLSVAGTIGVLRHGDGWLNQLKTYLDANFRHVHRVLADQLPRAGFRVPDSTYLAWIDISHYLGPNVDLTSHFAEAGVLIEGADKFVSDGDGCIRVNVASPRAVVDEGLSRIIAACDR